MSPFKLWVIAWVKPWIRPEEWLLGYSIETNLAKAGISFELLSINKTTLAWQHESSKEKHSRIT